MRGHAVRLSVAVIVAGWVLLPAGVFAQQAFSHARVVRLSYVSGTVAVKRSGSAEWTNAIVNTPIQEGFELSTSATSYAEVEFENGSSARLGELSQMAFNQLALDAEGNKLNRLTFEQGYATFHFMPEHHDAYSVMVADATLTPSGKSEFRTDLNQDRVRVEVFNGTVDVTGRSGSTKLGKDKVLEFNPGGAEVAFNIQQGITKDSWDKWAEARDNQVQLSMRNQAVPGQGMYGWGDLGAYGEWAMIPGFGYGWAPYAPMGWSPYSMGMWDMYPGMGLTWISSEPWGWLPYHYGMWNFDSGFGWFWMPGSFNYWSPALVSWYSGPGWLGWGPRGVGGRTGINSVTTVPGGVVRTGQMITLMNAGHERTAAGTSLAGPPPFQSGERTTLMGNPLRAGSPSSLQAAAPVSRMHDSPAPATVLMGGNAAAEKALLQNHPSGLGRALGLSHSEPLRAREGSTLGGRYAVGGTAGEFRGDASIRGGGNPGMRGGEGAVGSAPSRMSRGSAPVVLSHSQSAAPSSGGGGAVRSGGGGESRSVSSSPSVSASPSMSNSSRSASSSGGHH
jgi:hypothetical protein